jgi:hypothetical protein
VSDTCTDPASLRDLAKLDEKYKIITDAMKEVAAVRDKLTEKALELAKSEQVAKFEQVNNLRAQVTEERGRYVTDGQLSPLQTVSISR